MTWKNKICIGAAQFSGNYGITNKNKKKFIISNIKNIFKLVKKNNINYLDTAISYKAAERNILLSKINISKFQIITKVPKPDNEPEYIKRTLNKIISSKLRFKIRKFHSVLLHDCTNLKKRH